MIIILTARQFNILYKDDWVKTAEYLYEISKKQLYKNYNFHLLEDFVLANNYLNSVNKTMYLLEIYELLHIKYEVDKEYLKTLNIERIMSAFPFLDEKNYQDWLEKIETFSTVKFSRLIEQKKLSRNMSEYTSIIKQLNVVIAEFNELVWVIKELESYWYQLPVVNRKVFIKQFKENLSKIYNMYEKYKEQLDDKKN